MAQDSGVIEVPSRQERETKGMEQAAKRLGITDMNRFPEELMQLLNQRSFLGVAKELGVSKATLGYWLSKLGIEVCRVAVLKAQHRIVIVPRDAKVKIVER